MYLHTLAQIDNQVLIEDLLLSIIGLVLNNLVCAVLTRAQKRGKERGAQESVQRLEQLYSELADAQGASARKGIRPHSTCISGTCAHRLSDDIHVMDASRLKPLWPLASNQVSSRVAHHATVSS